MAHHAADIGDGGADFTKHRGPGRGGDRGDEDFAFFNQPQIIGRADHAGAAFDHAGRGGHAFEFGCIAGSVQPFLHGVCGDAPEHDGEGFGDHFGRSVQRRLRRGGLQGGQNRLAAGNLGWPIAGAGAGHAHAPTHAKIKDRVAHFVAVEKEHILCPRPEARALEEGGQFPHLAPEHRHRPMFDVKVVVFDIGKHGSGKAEFAVKRGLRIGVQQLAVFGSDPVPFGRDGGGGAIDGAARGNARGIVADIAHRDIEVFDPVLVVGIESVAGGEVEPRVLGTFPSGDPGLARRRAVHCGQDGIDGTCSQMGGDTRGHGQFGQCLEFVIGAEQITVHALYHFGDGLIRDGGELRFQETEEIQIGGIAEVQEFEVVVPGAIKQLDRLVIGF